jgi:Secretion system C-terminal sorting domain
MILYKYLISVLALFIQINSSVGQIKRDYQWVMGYDSSLLDVDGTVLQFDFNKCVSELSIILTESNFHMEGANTSMSDTSGHLLFYTNGCYIVNTAGDIMDNGSGINPGLMEDIYCPAGGSVWVQGVIALPSPGSDSLYYVFNLDMDLPYWLTDYVDIAPERLYYQMIDMSQAGGLGSVILKNQVAVQDTFARGSMKAVRHANGVDWWVIVPKSHSNCYYLTLVTAQGVEPPILECEGKIWNDTDIGAQTDFTPDGKKYMRCNQYNGMNIFDFDNATGELSNPIVIDFPNDTFYAAGVSVSANSRFLYLSARTKLYQFDLQASDIAASQLQIGEYDGYGIPNAPIFYISALAPDNKIYISGTSSHRWLHVIHAPDSLGVNCRFEQRGLALPAYNFATIPNFPHYRSGPNECDSTSSHKEVLIPDNAHRIFPNPATNQITIKTNITNSFGNIRFVIYNLMGQTVKDIIVSDNTSIDIAQLKPGAYYYTVQIDGYWSTGKFIKIAE